MNGRSEPRRQRRRQVPVALLVQIAPCGGAREARANGAVARDDSSQLPPLQQLLPWRMPPEILQTKGESVFLLHCGRQPCDVALSMPQVFSVASLVGALGHRAHRPAEEATPTAERNEVDCSSAESLCVSETTNAPTKAWTKLQAHLAGPQSNPPRPPPASPRGRPFLAACGAHDRKCFRLLLQAVPCTEWQVATNCKLLRLRLSVQWRPTVRRWPLPLLQQLCHQCSGEKACPAHTSAAPSSARGCQETPPC